MGSSDDDRETARENLVTTLNLLSAIMHRGICEEVRSRRKPVIGEELAH